MYIGKHGYTINKCELDNTSIVQIKKDMNVKPYQACKIGGPVSSYPIYRESTSKYYLPRYYGIEKFGNVNKNVLSKGISIDTPFEGDLFEYQVNIVNKFIDFVGDSGGGLLDVEPGKGKTVMALNIISKLGVKTLVVVHKSFLLNQWKERIEQFLPNARIGLIQGKTLDYKDKDIVIGMIQTLSTKTFSDDIIQEFGLSVYDECHHLSAEVFCNVMINVVTNYNLGLSGTMTRKDGLTKVFKYFIGPVIHKEKTDNNTPVLVKVATFKLDCEKFNETERDFRGNPMYSRMISKVSNNEHRINFMLNILHHELKVNNNQQIMILAHTKTLIKTLYDNLNEKYPDNVGLYIGGMKEDALKESESKQLIIATYSMASEGLDIKTLTTLLMATPKSDVCQSVGRILRSKHSNPLVIDILDTHDVFMSQFNKRKSYYLKKKYDIHVFESLNDYMDNNFYDIKIKKERKKKETTCFINLS